MILVSVDKIRLIEIHVYYDMKLLQTHLLHHLLFNVQKIKLEATT